MPLKVSITIADFRLAVQRLTGASSLMMPSYRLHSNLCSSEGAHSDQANALRHDKAARKVVKASKWLLLRSPRNTNRAQRVRLQEPFDANAPLMIAYMLREDLKALWSHRDPDEARGFWEDWYQRTMESGVAAIQRFAERIKSFIPGILAHAKFPLHTSLIEGINNKIKVIKRMA